MAGVQKLRYPTPLGPPLRPSSVHLPFLSPSSPPSPPFLHSLIPLALRGPERVPSAASTGSDPVRGGRPAPRARPPLPPGHPSSRRLRALCGIHAEKDQGPRDSEPGQPRALDPGAPLAPGRASASGGGVAETGRGVTEGRSQWGRGRLEWTEQGWGGGGAGYGRA